MKTHVWSKQAISKWSNEKQPDHTVPERKAPLSKREKKYVIFVKSLVVL